MITYSDLKNRKAPIAIVGLGYVGLPLAVAFAEHFDVIGFDINAERIAQLESGVDRTLEVDNARLQSASMELTSDPAALGRAGIIIVAVPTPIDKNRRPDLTPVTGASTLVGQNLSKDAIVIYESTVYPGVTDDICGPILEKESGLVCGRDFFLGYSPERINPGDKVHTLQTITKIVAGQNPDITALLAQLYGTVVQAGTHRASSIKVAEAAKVIENTQRDLNIALMNELSRIFSMMGIDTLEVLEAAGTKWNFLPFRPGLVGGHCIGVDPYYLTFKAEELGYHPQVILSGRRINDSMGSYVAQTMIKKMIRRSCAIKGARNGGTGPDLQGELPGSAQYTGHGHYCRTGGVRVRGPGTRCLCRQKRGLEIL
jgi:UDP-N-acetyl-D-galactosamine dehydrogenase